MKKIIFLIAILSLGVMVFAEDSEDSSVAKAYNNLGVLTPKEEPEDYLKIENGPQTLYYDKFGKPVIKSNTLNNSTFFYTTSGRFLGTDLVLDTNKTYYDNSLSKFIGTCEDSGCKDKNCGSISVAPLPTLN